MRKRRLLLLLLLAGVVLTAGIIFLFWSEREPEYRGAKLSEWVDVISARQISYFPSLRVSSSAANNEPEATKQALEAVNQIGTNAIPYLLKWIQYKPPPWKTAYLAIISQVFHSTIADHEASRAEGAMKAIPIFGRKAAGAVPDLARLMDDPKAGARAQVATAVLCNLRQDLVLANIVLLTNSSPPLRLESVRLLCSAETPPEPAVPALVARLQDSSEDVAAAAAYVLGSLGMKAEMVVPALEKSLQERRPLVRKAAIRALGWFHLQARTAVPALQGLLNDSDALTRKYARDALEGIDPRALKSGRP